MATYIIRRLIHTILIIFIVTFLTFAMIYMMPGDPVLLMLGDEATKEQYESLRKELWLDRSFIVQYGHWLNNTLHGNLGKSIVMQETVSNVILRCLPVSLHLASIGLILGNIIGILAGIVCAIRRGTSLDSIVSISAIIGISIPIFWLGVLGIYIFGLKLGWLPIHGYTSPLVDFWKSHAQLVMPVFCLALPSIAILARQTRSSMLEVIRQDYIRTAWSKGLNGRVVVFRHALKNGLIPVVTLIGMQVRVLFGGAVLVETVFNLPGLGSLLAQAALGKDLFVIQGGVLLISIAVCLSNLAVDISYGWLDPRVVYK